MFCFMKKKCFLRDFDKFSCSSKFFWVRPMFLVLYFVRMVAGIGNPENRMIHLYV